MIKIYDFFPSDRENVAMLNAFKLQIIIYSLNWPWHVIFMCEVILSKKE